MSEPLGAGRLQANSMVMAPAPHHVVVHSCLQLGQCMLALEHWCWGLASGRLGGDCSREA